MSTSSSRLIHFGDFEVDPRAGELRKHGRAIRLQEQPVQLLLLLLEHPGELVTREQARKALWKDDTFVDYDHGLGAALNRLRAALGDSASAPRYIETLPRRGYRFIAPVVQDSPEPESHSASEEAEAPANRHGKTLALAALLLGIGFAFALYDRGERASAANDCGRERLRQYARRAPVRQSERRSRRRLFQ